MSELKMANGPSRADIQPYTMSSSADAEHLPATGPKPETPRSRRRMKPRTKLLLLNAVSIVGGIAIWWILALNGFQFPTPPEVVAKAVQLWQAGILQDDILASLARVLTGFLLGSAAAIPVGFLMGWYTVARGLFEPWIQFFRTIPPLALHAAGASCCWASARPRRSS